jgi:hypothetical protein
MIRSHVADDAVSTDGNGYDISQVPFKYVQDVQAAKAGE